MLADVADKCSEKTAKGRYEPRNPWRVGDCGGTEQRRTASHNSKSSLYSPYPLKKSIYPNDVHSGRVNPNLACDHGKFRGCARALAIDYANHE
jgi:hypothetical protein